MGVMIFNAQGGLELSLPPVPATLPELCLTLCQTCEGTGYRAIDEYDACRCEVCDGYGALAVCSVCGEVPASDTDACGCSLPALDACNTLAPCEFCQTLHPASSMIFGSCTACFDEAHERYKAEMGEDGLTF